MTLERLWAGWRSEYISSVDGGDHDGPPDGPDGHDGDGDGGDGHDGDGHDGDAERLAAAPHPSGHVDPGCVFCRILSSGVDDAETHVVWRDPSGLVVALLNAYPYATGHLMVMPIRHTGDLETLSPEESTALWAGVADSIRAVKVAYRPDGLNVGANLGRAAGAGVPGHLHMHVLPRWGGDSNFMTSVAETRVLPEALPVTADKLRRAWPT